MTNFRSKQDIIKEFQRVANLGWVKSVKKYGNAAGPGNTLEELLGIEENNLPIPNAGEWELKSQRKKSTSLVTLFHSEPSPRAVKFVSKLLLPKYGWKHKEAGKNHPASEMSFRSTTWGHRYNARGFRVIPNDVDQKIEIAFNASEAIPKHKQWLDDIRSKVGNTNDFKVRPYWGYDDLYCLARSKIVSTFFVLCKHKKESGDEYFKYEEFFELTNLSQDKFIDCFRDGTVAVDFDARTGHNHGTKFRIHRNHFTKLFENVSQIPIQIPP